jgi:cation diffusion facilitator CzcD-associated flavoprotein CzcO
MNEAALDVLARQVARDLEMIAHPRAAWLTPRKAPDGSDALDVLVVGAGQGGLATAFALKRLRVDNQLVIDKAPRGREGPWVTYARMPNLRSPKDQNGPDLGLPSLTYQAWHEAAFGGESWRALRLIASADWNDYLLWFRRTVGVEVRNETELAAIEPAGDGLLRARLRAHGAERIVHARKIVLATGQDGAGRWWMPPFLDALPASLRAHTCEAIDFAALRGRTVFVLGAGASAFDNAACALEAGAAEVHLFCRRAEPQVVQPYRWLTFAGFLHHLGEMDDAWRWRFMSRILGMREGFPQDTWDRCARHAAFRLRAGEPWLDARARDGRAVVTTPRGEFAADFLIAGTGVDMDFAARPELAACADNIATWGDRYEPPPAERDARLARFPYLAPDYAFVEKTPGRTPWIANVHFFGIAATMSFGPSGSSINGMTTAVPKLAQGVTRGLFAGDLEAHWRALLAYDLPQATLRSPTAKDGTGNA